MVERISKYRIKFTPGKQRIFLSELERHLEMSKDSIAKRYSISRRAYSDILSEKTTLPCRIFNDAPNSLQKKFKVTYLDQYWYCKKGAKKGGEVTYKKYGKVPVNESLRKKAFLQWWERTGNKISVITKPRDIQINTTSTDYAELIGIILGDGHISQYQISITLHSVVDRKYIRHVRDLIKKVLHIDAVAIKRNNVTILYINSIKVVKHLYSIGVPPGNKTKLQVDVPTHLTKKEGFRLAALRGLIDTDGSFYVESHTYKGTHYAYPRLNFTNTSLPLIHFVYSSLKELGIAARYSKDMKRVQVENITEICKYSTSVGFNNPKHSQKLHRFLAKRGTIEKNTRRSG